jgi:hypothetical protein
MTGGTLQDRAGQERTGGLGGAGLDGSQLGKARWDGARRGGACMFLRLGHGRLGLPAIAGRPSKKGEILVSATGTEHVTINRCHVDTQIIRGELKGTSVLVLDIRVPITFEANLDVLELAPVLGDDGCGGPAGRH